jgi:DNA repair protein RecO (recombination protein O)
MLLKTRAVVLDVSPYAEASVIVKAYTATHGLQSFLVNGVRKQRPRFAPTLFQPLALIELVAYFRKQGGLHRVTEVVAMPPLVHIPYDTVKTTMAIFMAEVVYRSVREEESNTELFGFIDHAVQILDLQHDTPTDFHLIFCLQLTRYLGFYPGGRYGNGSGFFDLKEGVFRQDVPQHPYYLDPRMSSRFQELLDSSMEDGIHSPISLVDRKSLLQTIISYYELHHTQGFGIRSHQVLAELMQ